MRWTLLASSDVRSHADGKVVWSWRPWAGAKSAGDDPQATVTKRSWTPGRARTSLLTPSRREGRVFRLNLWRLLVCFLHCTRGCGCSQHPAFPAPSGLSGGAIDAKLGRISSREREARPLCCLTLL